MSGREPGRKTEETGHEYVRDRLSAYLDGQLLGQERQAVEEHLAACSTCRWDLQTLRQTVLLTRNLPAMPVPRSFTLPVPAQAPARAARPRWRLVPAFQFATAMVALLLFFAVAGDLALTSMRPASMPAPDLVRPEAAVETVVVDVTEVVEAPEAEEMMAMEAAPAEPSTERAVEKAGQDAGASPPVARTLPTEAPLAAAAAPEVTDNPDLGAAATAPAGMGGAAPDFEDTPPPPSEGEGEPSVETFAVPETVSDTVQETPAAEAPVTREAAEVPVTPEVSAPAAEGEATAAPEMEAVTLAEPSATPEPQPTLPPEPLATPAPPVAPNEGEPISGPTAQVEVEEPVEALAAGEPSSATVDERAGEEAAEAQALQAQATNWLRIIEYALAALLVLLVGVTAALMVWRRRAQ